MRVACCQIRCRPGDWAGNLSRGLAAVQDGVVARADVIVLPEAWATGFAFDDLPACVDAAREALDTLKEELRSWDGILVAGSQFTRDGNRVHNELIALHRGEVVARYRKLHLFAGLGEDRHLAPGSNPQMMETPLGPAGLALCYDLRFPELFRWCARRDVAVFLLPSQWPFPRIQHWRLLCQARAVENLAFLVGVNTAGDSAIDRLYGHSMVVDPWGEILWEAEQEETVGIVDLDPERLMQVRSKLNIQSDARDDLLTP